MQKWIIGLIAILALFSHIGCDRTQPVSGFKDFKFGMSISEVDSLIQNQGLCALNYDKTEHQIFCNGGLSIAGKEPQIIAFEFKADQLSKILLNDIRGLSSEQVEQLQEKLGRQYGVIEVTETKQPFAGKLRKHVYGQGKLVMNVYVNPETEQINSMSLVFQNIE